MRLSVAAMCSSLALPANSRMMIFASALVRLLCSPVRGFRTRSSECCPPCQWMVMTTSRRSSSTSTTISRMSVLTRRCFICIVVDGASQAASRSAAMVINSSMFGGAGSLVELRFRRASHARCRASALFHRVSSSAATIRFSGSTDSYRRSARRASYVNCCSSSSWARRRSPPA